MMNVSKALLVDDSKVARVMLKRTLEARGLDVDTAASGQEALDYLKDNAPDVIFMDYMMPGMDGFEVTGMITANPRTSTIPVIMCTADVTPRERERAHESGARGIVKKPFGDDALDVVFAELRDRVAAPERAVGPTPVMAAASTAPAPADDIVKVAERIAHEVAEKLVREAIADLSATSDEASLGIAHAVATGAAQDALASWRVEAARTNEQIEHVAVAAAERVARTVVQEATDAAVTARRSAETSIEAKLQEALAGVASTAERVARQTLESARPEIEDASRRILESARAEMQESARTAAEAAAGPVAGAAARDMIDQVARVRVAAVDDLEPALREVEQRAVAAAEEAARTIVRQATEEAEAARRSTETLVETRLGEALAAASLTAERVARATLDSVKAEMKDESRQVAEFAPADLQDSVRVAAEAAARPVAEAAARAAAEEVARTSLEAAREGEAALRSQLVQHAIAAAERAAQTVVQKAVEEAESARGSTGVIADEKLQEAMAGVKSIAERAARKVLESAKAEMEDASRQVLESARGELEDSVRIAAEAAARPVAELAAHGVVEQVARQTLATLHEDEVALRGRVEQRAIAAAERVAQTITQRAVAEAEAARQTAEKAGDERLREALVTVKSTGERVVLDTLESAKASIADASRQVLESARAELHESVRIAAEAAARPVADSAARAVIEQVARETLAVALEEEAASRKRVEQNAIAVAERVGRELVQLAFGTSVSRPQAATGEAGHAVESARTVGEEPFAPQSDAIHADWAAPMSQTGESPDAESVETPETAYKGPATRADHRAPMPAAWTAPAALLPWLAALTLAVLYLLVRGFL